MDIHRALRYADEILDDPLKARFRSFWSSLACEKDVVQTAEFCRLTGVIDFVHLPEIGVTPYRFYPGVGFAPHDDARQWSITMPEVTPCLRTMCPGDVITCHGKAKIYDAKITYDKNVIFCRWPQFQGSLPWNVIHWFSGGYMGWSRAISWLAKREPECAIGQQIFVDSDQKVMQCWSQDAGRQFVNAPICPHAKWDPAPVTGVCGEVADLSIARLACFQNNVIETMSPPCISWSRGGKNCGLNSSAGFAFFEAIQVALTQPVIVIAECADETPKHPHFCLLADSFRLLGYKSVWQQVVPTHFLTHMSRTRWLAVWIRHDIPGKCIDAVFELRPNQFTPWHAAGNKLFAPDQIHKQLVLDEHLRQIYGDPNLLPPAKRYRYTSPTQVFEIRQAQVTSPMPTLCASYTKQHCLSSEHVREKGIFASLQIIDDQVLFLDPLRFIALFGSVGKVTIPCEINLAFHILGNAIIVPHALLACSVAFSAIGDFRWTPTGLVAECWQDRLQFASSIVRVVDEFLVVHPLLDFCLDPPIRIPAGDGDLDFVITSPNRPDRVSGKVSMQLTLADFVESVIGVPQYMHSLLAFGAETDSATPELRLQRVASIAATWKISLDSLVIAVVDFALLQAVTISPTLDFVLEKSIKTAKVIKVPPKLDNDAFFAHEQLCPLLSLIEKQSMCAEDEHVPSKQGVAMFYPLQANVLLRHGPNGLWPHVQGLLAGYAHGGNLSIVQSPTVTLLGQQVVVCFSEPVLHNRVVVALEDIPTSHLQCTVSDKTIRADAEFDINGRASFLEQINGVPIPRDEEITLHHADLLSIRPIEQIEKAIRCGGHHEGDPSPALPSNATFYQRCEFSVNTSGWIATDELIHLVSSIQDHLPSPAPHFEVMQWQGQSSDLESLLLGEPEFLTTLTTWLFVLVQSHWMLCIVNTESVRAHVSVQGCASSNIQPLIAALARVLDLAPSRIAVSFVPTDLVPHMCGWTFVQQFAANSSFVPQQLVVSNSALPTNFVDAIQEVLASSREEWMKAGASPTLCNFARDSRRLFFYHLADHADPLEASHGFQQREPTLMPAPQPPVNADPIRVRLQHLWRQPAWLASDTCDHVLTTLRNALPHTLFGPPLQWDSQSSTLSAFNGFQCNIGPYNQAFLLILWDTHWITCEIHKAASIWVTIQAPVQYYLETPPLVDAIRTWLGIDQLACHLTFVAHNTPPNACGWTCLLHLFQRFGVDFPLPTVQQHLALVLSPHAELVNAIRALALRQWNHDFVPPALISFAQSALVLSINSILDGRIVTDYASGGSPDAKSPPAVPPPPQPAQGSADPWLKKDPWQLKTKQQTRWEDLLLADDHPFVGENQTKVQQTHRLQITANTGGLVLTTKAHLQELSLTRCKKPLGAILPAIDSSMKALDIQSQGPFEVVLQDPNAGVSYKRLVSLVVFSGDINYQLQSPAHSFKTAAISEIVVEIDNRLIAKDEFDFLKAAPATNIKKLFCDQLPQCASQATFYSFRQNHHPSGGKQDLQLQCIVKIPTSHRKQVLEISGKAGFLTRDFLEKGSQSADSSVIPRFWPPTPRDLRELTITLQAFNGHAGVVLTKRGLAARSWNDSIATARQTLIPDDNRLCPGNMSIVPRVTYEAAGWPASTTPKDVVVAVLKATSLPPVPMRTFRLGGVNVWVLAFASSPAAQHRKFTVQINEHIYEILLTEAPSQPPAKGSSKGKPKKKDADHAFPIVQPPLPSGDRQRLDKLEAKFENLGRQVSSIEEKQSIFESKIDSKFETIHDSLRQLLQQSQPRQREGPSGETPPNKHSKH